MMMTQQDVDRFTSHPETLLTIVDATASVFSGSQVLRAIDTGYERTGWTGADLDIYTTSPEGEQIINHFEKEGYTASLQEGTGEIDRPYADSTGVACVVHLKKSTQKVDVVFSTTQSVLTPIAHFWSTHVCNIITAHAIYVAYPRSTLRGVGYRRPWAAHTSGIAEAYQKYDARGYAIHRFGANTEATTDAPDRAFYCPHTPRSFGDNGTTMERYRQDKGCASQGRCIENRLNEVQWTWGGNACACCDRRTSEDVRIT